MSHEPHSDPTLASIQTEGPIILQKSLSPVLGLDSPGCKHGPRDNLNDNRVIGEESKHFNNGHPPQGSCPSTSGKPPEAGIGSHQGDSLSKTRASMPATTSKMQSLSVEIGTTSPPPSQILGSSFSSSTSRQPLSVALSPGFATTSSKPISYGTTSFQMPEVGVTCP